MLAAASSCAPGQPVNDLCANAVEVEWSQLPATTPPVSIARAAVLPEVADPCTPTGYTVWYTFVAGDDATIRIETCAATNPLITLPDTTLALYESPDGTCNALAAVWCNDDECGFRSALIREVRSGVRYFIQAGQFRGAATSAPAAPDDQISIAVSVLPPAGADQWEESFDAGASVETVQVVQTSLPPARIVGELGYAGDIDMYRVDVCAASPLTATTVGGPQLDTQLFLFRADGTGIVMNDDDPLSLSNQSRLVLAQGLEPGAYLLAVSSFNLAPLDASLLPLWNDQPFRAQRAPDGPGAAQPVTSWRATGGLQGPYVIELGGFSPAWTCTSNCPSCIADFNSDGGIDGTDIEAFFSVWESGQTCADTNADGGVDGGDIETFIIAWEAGGC